MKQLENPFGFLDTMKQMDDDDDDTDDDSEIGADGEKKEKSDIEKYFKANEK